MDRKRRGVADKRIHPGAVFVSATERLRGRVDSNRSPPSRPIPTFSLSPSLLARTMAGSIFYGS
jgi:hypothetical protein